MVGELRWSINSFSYWFLQRYWEVEVGDNTEWDVGVSGETEEEGDGSSLPTSGLLEDVLEEQQPAQGPALPPHHPFHPSKAQESGGSTWITKVEK